MNWSPSCLTFWREVCHQGHLTSLRKSKRDGSVSTAPTFARAMLCDVLPAAASGEWNEAPLVLPIVSSIARSVGWGAPRAFPPRHQVHVAPPPWKPRRCRSFLSNRALMAKFRKLCGHNANPLANPLSEAHCRHDESYFPDAPAPERDRRPPRPTGTQCPTPSSDAETKMPRRTGEASPACFPLGLSREIRRYTRHRQP